MIAVKVEDHEKIVATAQDVYLACTELENSMFALDALCIAAAMIFKDAGVETANAFSEGATGLMAQLAHRWSEAIGLPAATQEGSAKTQ